MPVPSAPAAGNSGGVPVEGVVITDVAARDGLQNEKTPVPAERKVELMEALMDAGVRRLEAAAYVHPKVVPQMADAAEVMSRIERRPGVALSVLVPNLRGAERALQDRPDEIRLTISASESHNKANLNSSIDETIRGAAAVADFAAASGVSPAGKEGAVPVAAVISTVFGCPFEGAVPLERVAAIIARLAEAGFRRFGLADTTGVANPAQVARTVETLKEQFPACHFWLHLHNTRGLALANAYAGYEAGIRHFDASLGGIGGCPFAPGATGNVSTEDLVHMFHLMGVPTGIDLEGLLAIGDRLKAVVGRDLDSAVQKAGPAYRLHSLEGAPTADSARTRPEN